MCKRLSQWEVKTGTSAIGNPQTLIGCNLFRAGLVAKSPSRNNIGPRVHRDQIQVGQSQLLCLIGHVVHAKRALAAIGTLPPKCKERLSQVECELRGVWVERRVLTTQLHAAT